MTADPRVTLLSDDLADYAFIDTETRALPGVPLEKGNVKTAGAHEYSRHAKVIIVTYAIGDGPVKCWALDGDLSDTLHWQDAPADLRAFRERAETRGDAWFVAWNMAFDRLAMNRGMVSLTRRPAITIPMTIDAMAQGASSGLPSDLAGAARAIGLAQKVDEGKALIGLFCTAGGATPVSAPDEWARFIHYAEQDVAALRDVFRATRQLPRAEWEVYWANEAINDRGLPFDRTLVSRAAALSDVYNDWAQGEVRRITGENWGPKHHVALAGWAFDRLQHIPEAVDIMVKSYDTEDGEDGEPIRSIGKVSLDRARIEKLIPLLEARDERMGLTDDEFAALELCEVKLYAAGSTTMKFHKALPVLGPDDRLRGQYTFNGAAQTGRFSSRGVQCVVGEHEVLTRQGWVPIRDVAGTEPEIMQWCPDTDTLRWGPSVVHAFDAPPTLAKLDGPVIKGVFTWDHRMPTRSERGALVDYTPRKLLGASKRGRMVVQAPVAQPGLPLSDDQLRFIVAMQSDGHWAKRAALFKFTKPRKIRRMSDLLGRLGVPYKVSRWPSQPDAVNFRVNVSDVPHWLVKDFGPWVLGLSARQAELVLDEYAHWDGHRHPKNGALTASSPRRDQMEWLVTIAALAGRTATLSPYRQKRHAHPRWCLYVRDSDLSTVYRDQMEVVPGAPVFCPTVPTGYWLTRYDNRVYITGNTHNLTRAYVGMEAGDPEAEVRAIDFLLDLPEQPTVQDLERFTEAFGPAGRTLSRLIRPSILAPEGQEVVWADYANIEARVLPWLAGSVGAERKLDIFRTVDKDPTAPDVYMIQAAATYGKRAEDVSKDERQTGKVQELSLGFGGGWRALLTMAANYRISLSREEAEPLVRAWRASNQWAVEFWADAWRAAMLAMNSPGTAHAAGRLTYFFDGGHRGGSLFCLLPSQRLLTYPALKYRMVEKTAEDGSTREEEVLTYMAGGGRRTLWQGILCIAGDAEVATARGWVRLDHVQVGDLIWDGEEFVSHEGLLYKGEQDTLSVDGINMTPDHEVLTNEGWKAGAQCEGLDRPEVRMPDGYPAGRKPRGEDGGVAVPVRLRAGGAEGAGGPAEDTEPQRRAVRAESPVGGTVDARDVEAPGLCGMAVDARPLPPADASGVAQLRRARHPGGAGVGDVRGVLGGHGADLPQGAYAGAGGQRRAVPQGELPLGDVQGTGSQYPQHPAGGHRAGAQTYRHFKVDASVPLAPRAVYDILNCGPRRRFVVRGEAGPVIVHNCENATQAAAADLLRGSLVRIEDEMPGYLVGHTHDELIGLSDSAAVEQDKEDLRELMTELPDWAEGLPVAADVDHNEFYTKTKG